MKVRVPVIALAAVSILIVSASWELPELFTRSKVIFRKGPDTWVKLDRANRTLRPLEHPYQVRPELMEKVLLSLVYFKPDQFSIGSKQGRTYELFTAEEAKLVAEPLSLALAQAGPEQWVDFSVQTFRGQSFVGNFIKSDGVMFIKDGKLNIAFRNIAKKTTPDDDRLGVSDPTRSYRSFTKLTAAEGFTIHADNWVILDPQNLGEPEAPAKVETPAEDAAPAEDATPAEEAAPARSVKERLVELQELYDQELITEEEYKQKRQEILKEL